MLNVDAEKSNGTVTIAAIGIKMSGEEGVGVLLTLDLVEEINTLDEAKAVESVLPGAVQWWERTQAAIRAGEAESALNGATEGSRAASNAIRPGEVNAPTPIDHPVRLSLGAVGAPEVVEGLATVRKARLKATAKVCTYVVRATVQGLEPAQVAAIVGWFQKSVAASMTAVQAVLPFTRKLLADVGQVASGRDEKGTEWAGVVLSRGRNDDGDYLEIQEVGGGPGRIVSAAQISGALVVEGDGGKSVDELVTVYVKAARKAKVPASWVHLVAAMGRAYLGGDDAPDGAWRLTDGIVADAVEAQRQGQLALA